MILYDIRPGICAIRRVFILYGKSKMGVVKDHRNCIGFSEESRSKSTDLCKDSPLRVFL